MTSRRNQVLAALAADDPFANFDAAGAPTDLTGWGSAHPYLAAAVKEHDAPVIVDVGVWKGGSTITFARALAEAGVDGAVLSVDTFLGSAEHHLNPEWRTSLRIQRGHPRLYDTFLANVAAVGLHEYVVPLPLDSRNAALLLPQCGIVPDVVHIDASHDYESVRQDLDHWYEALCPGGTMICDDYIAGWPGVVRAVDVFCMNHPVERFEAERGKCRFTKPAHDVESVSIDEAAVERRALTRQLQQAQSETATALVLIEDARRRIAAFESSRSWRATAWLRSLDITRARRR